MSSPVPPEIHGGNRVAIAARLGCRPADLLDLSASLVPFGPPLRLRLAALAAMAGPALRDYPDRGYGALRQAIAALHGLPPEWVLPGNGAAELFTWAARDAAATGVSALPAPGFADYRRALATWGGASRPLPLRLDWPAGFPQHWGAAFADDQAGSGDDQLSGHSQAPPVLWITNPHNPSGQLWSRDSLAPLLERHRLVIVDEAFLPLVPAGEDQSLAPLLLHHPNLVVIRSLTKLLSIAGLRLGYALAAPERLQRWSSWRDPWPVNGPAAAMAAGWLVDGPRRDRWAARVQRWVAMEGPWLAAQLAALPGLTPMPSAANFLLVHHAGGASLEPLRLALEQRHRILLRGCRSFEGLGEGWLRIGLQDRRRHRRLLQALALEWGRCGLQG
ncbi:pyridoxal phosphate-dependent aminotransferase [Synechococcus sp. CBW1107]|uniref:pyridoxal phosphate-dependent aminotransferase n=1 Tax=Synechococcus sp. CBW1107 TaxID=2789857 RepID=UPI002AD576A8|nr:aminotransferase class I/II-fold pyridoxal phosphate-dependent enzyme [Synechococcus sp. CBW1107]CAK6688817.1 Threonine-phosphate decarboxylase [Synechococcus sp. CBW1107]